MVKDYEQTMIEKGKKLIKAAHDYWQSYQKYNKPTAVVWLRDDSGHFVLFTRGEYLSQIMNNVDNLSEERPLNNPFEAKDKDEDFSPKIGVCRQAVEGEKASSKGESILNELIRKSYKNKIMLIEKSLEALIDQGIPLEDLCMKEEITTPGKPRSEFVVYTPKNITLVTISGKIVKDERGIVPTTVVKQHTENILKVLGQL